MVYGIIILAVLAVVGAGCLVTLRRRGGSGERGAQERAAAGRGLSDGVSGTNATRQNIGPS
ncbi:hypothetical protein GTW43_25235 [Streptomyces sp. SID5785]|uniref:hypothetical protein n=1 Tax=Streptomyces sp. SID5785 TaxID=2690309 RepID=UPI00136109A2|nr:hypothetical protein [Streptomyces sp. SID5785]MZD08358.1 hypothetical protein [Streptomyces sp. SID5785]